MTYCHEKVQNNNLTLVSEVGILPGGQKLEVEEKLTLAGQWVKLTQSLEVVLKVVATVEEVVFEWLVPDAVELNLLLGYHFVRVMTLALVMEMTVVNHCVWVVIIVMEMTSVNHCIWVMTTVMGMTRGEQCICLGVTVMEITFVNHCVWVVIIVMEMTLGNHCICLVATVMEMALGNHCIWVVISEMEMTLGNQHERTEMVNRNRNLWVTFQTVIGLERV